MPLSLPVTTVIYRHCLEILPPRSEKALTVAHLKVDLNHHWSDCAGKDSLPQPSQDFDPCQYWTIPPDREKRTNRQTMILQYFSHTLLPNTVRPNRTSGKSKLVPLIVSATDPLKQLKTIVTSYCITQFSISADHRLKQLKTIVTSYYIAQFSVSADHRLK